MKRSTLLWMLCVAAAFTAAGLAAVQNGWSQGVFVAQASPTPDTYINTVQLAASTPLPIESIPSYQGAHNETTFSANGPARIGYDYEVEADKTDIVAFYKAWFAQEGWHLQWEKPLSNKEYWLVYRWEGPNNSADYQFSLGITIRYHYAANPKTVHVSIDTARVPNLRKTLLQPGAENLSVFYESTWSSTPAPADTYKTDIERTVTYEINMPASEVFDYYKRYLGEYGWKFTGAASTDGVNDDPDGIVFNCTEGACSIELHADDIKPGRAKVKMSIGGDTNIHFQP